MSAKKQAELVEAINSGNRKRIVALLLGEPEKRKNQRKRKNQLKRKGWRTRKDQKFQSISSLP